VSKIISVFKSRDRKFVRYLGGDSQIPSEGDAWIARHVGAELSETMGAGIVIYEKVTVDWDLPFDEVITLLEGELRVHSAGTQYDLMPGDMAWFPAKTPLTYEVKNRAVVSYAIYPLPPRAAN
jgi:ethanolamine utilization protein EutQ